MNTSREVHLEASEPGGARAFELQVCGHDAPIYTVVEEIVEHSGTPYFCFKDIDENKPTGSIKIRTETIGYFLKRYREDIVAAKKKKSAIDTQLQEFERKLRNQLLKERLSKIAQHDEHPDGALPTIHVSLGQLAASRPPVPPSHASGD